MARQYLPSRDIEIDEDEFARFCEMTEKQMDAEVERANSDFSEMLAGMTPLQEYRYWRNYILISIIENRRRLRNPNLARIEIIDDLWRKSIKKSQQSLLKHRHHLRTGIWPGSS